VSHANAALTPRGRLRLARLIVDEGWPIARAAERYEVSWPTAKRWAERYRRHGVAGMADHSSRPHHSPSKTPQPTVRKIVHLRWKQRLGPVQIAGRLNMPASTVHAVLTRCRLNRLTHIDRATGEAIRRYEHDRPGAMLHVDVKKLGNIPDGGGWRTVGRAQGSRNSLASTPARKGSHPVIGYSCLHTALDDCSRLAYTEILPDERKETAAAFLIRAHAWYAAAGITIERVISDNGACYRSRDWAAACAALGIIPKRTRPCRPQTNGKVERFHRTLADEWAYAQPYTTETQRRAALDPWLHLYNHHRGHTALGGLPPASRVTNLSGQHS
jgi:Integrase core domain/leucine-zipper of insertion element IS481